MSFNLTTYPNWKSYLLSFVKRRAEFKCENCKAEDTKENNLKVYPLDQDPNNTSRKNLALICKKCRPILREQYHPGQIIMFPKYIPKWLQERKDTLWNFNRN